MTNPTNDTNPIGPQSRAGFTLIELSIVLVIIGLIVGGVLVGQDLIKAAELRATMSQIEKYDAATLTFRNKYNGLPGDVLNPASFGLDSTGIQAAANSGNANGLIDRSSNVSATAVDWETAAFFRHLGQANLINEPITVSAFGATVPANIATILPLSKLGRGNYVAAAQINGINFFNLINGTIAAGVWAAGTGGLTPTEAFNIDSKRDDGNPSTGSVIALEDTTFVTADPGATGAALTQGECFDNAGTAAPAFTDDSYAMGSTAIIGNVAGCNLRLRASF